MKKFITTIILLIGFSSIVWAKQPVVGFVTGASGLGDLSYNDMSYGGVRKAQQEYKFKLIILEPGKSGKSTEKEFINIIKISDILLLVGAQHAQLVEETAGKFPDKKFILLEVPIDTMENVSSVAFKQGEGSFLAGALAAYMSKTGKIGFIGATPVPAVREFEHGYIKGAEYAVPEIKVEVAYVTPLGDFSGFKAPDKGYVIAMNQYRNGADTVFTVAGLTGNGVIEAARRSGNFAIGVDSDQDSLAKGFVLTSMIKRLGIASYNELKAAMENRFNPGPTYYGLKEGGIGLSQMKYTRDKIPEKILKKIAQIKSKIINGEIQVNFKTPPR
ncbi:BMP family lipoprotein [Maridesulfovibrio hydrothermalis]|uniref:Basic membrane lipoprotein n=1 Tax=Maridesulfovibrio hydrothermalis AM13 = DSM 14728 TaxID=1121451 RepID=L0R9P1_9BACT|nr:BMP family ABC transporter substrate-binding protein [Maridesulfovibrio hydrothermalis]CCO23493.1 Basic membrane lipoprotein [Maridesulfovibrio hydrothermalis AM13 = DSM 14728]